MDQNQNRITKVKILVMQMAVCALTTGALMAQGVLTKEEVIGKNWDVGIYVASPCTCADGTVWKELPAEVVNWKTGGVVKHALTDGIIKGDVNGRILGKESSVAMSGTSRDQIYVRTLEGVSAEEYVLLRLREHTDAREFRSITGGVFHESGGATRDRIPFIAKRVGPRLWQIVLVDLPNGEYGFLPPVNTLSLAASGKLYSFQVSPERVGPQSPTAATSFQSDDIGFNKATFKALLSAK
jgi:hypothetical protein